MTGGLPTGLSSRTGWLARWTPQRTAWLLFAPPAVMVGLRWVLELLAERQLQTHTLGPALMLTPVSAPEGLADLLWPVALAVGGLVTAGLLLHRLGWRRLMPAAGLLWVVFWLGGSAALLQRQLNQQGLFWGSAPLQGAASPGLAPAGPALAPAVAQVLASEFRRPSLRSGGGTQLVLQVPGLAVPQRLLMEDARAALLQPGDRVALQLARGRFNGVFVTDWRAVPAAPPAPPIASAPLLAVPLASPR